jgi:hypothetical protein
MQKENSCFLLTSCPIRDRGSVVQFIFYQHFAPCGQAFGAQKLFLPTSSCQKTEATPNFIPLDNAL